MGKSLFMSRLIDLTGRIFGRLTVIERCGSNSESQPLWKCKCTCGIVKTVNGRDLREGHSTSCGCFRLEEVKTRCITHGKTLSKEYKSWSGMKERCLATSKKRKWYYDLGIKVCKRWENSFEKFLSDMGEKPTHKHSIDRFPNPSGDYKPSNCRWATQKEQMNNLRKHKFIPQILLDTL